MTKKPTPIAERTEEYWPLLNQVIDPEIELGVVDLGLIYDINIDKNGLATIRMTLTTPLCPFGPALVKQIQDKILTYPGVTDHEIQMVWDPVWTNDMIDPELKDFMMGL